MYTLSSIFNSTGTIFTLNNVLLIFKVDYKLLNSGLILIELVAKVVLDSLNYTKLPIVLILINLNNSLAISFYLNS